MKFSAVAETFFMDTNDRDMDQKSQQRGTSVRPATDNADLPDSPHDAERLKPDETILDLPDVADIPGQEFVHVPQLGELADTTIASADEEGEGILDDQPEGNEDDSDL